MRFGRATAAAASPAARTAASSTPTTSTTGPGGGPNLDNLLLLCRRHHRLVHEGGYRVDRHGRFYDPWGQPLPVAPRLPRGSPSELIERHHTLAIDADTCESGTGDPMNLGYAVDALLSAAGVPI